MTATHFLVCSEPENVYHIGRLVGYSYNKLVCATPNKY